ncbi:tripartite tricarboxylate transporter TctB family protein [Aureimonas jatrophae]|uniref:Tripartite tricarboxylate transporter TctB family protein n=1 Tax=Aureimonas jatrophae TaxID=1166073 RepID=A0A1H0DJ04_9HYPH|nr:tripartite tricarboxylate transporter TctB family protein [Aureimonas jatrophae]MBB3951917.1 putative membrane protein [Aureimonas jatrophae]SDN70039.1 Tripartite tricarboxylate transporter TctB family protein [Aureimonas jatrophae]
MNAAKGSAAPYAHPRAGADPRNIAAGLVLIALSALAFWLTADISRGTLRSVGPAMLPQAVAVLIAICGVALVVTGATRRSDAEPAVWSLRGPLLVTAGIALFALTIKPMHLPGFDTWELGLVISGPLAIVVGGYASPRARLRDLVILALSLTPFCMLLFGDMLNLPIPIMPRSLADLLFSGWSYKTALRATAAVLFAIAAFIFFATRGGPPPALDVARHDGTI